MITLWQIYRSASYFVHLYFLGTWYFWGKHLFRRNLFFGGPKILWRPGIFSRPIMFRGTVFLIKLKIRVETNLGDLLSMFFCTFPRNKDIKLVTFIFFYIIFTYIMPGHNYSILIIPWSTKRKRVINNITLQTNLSFWFICSLHTFGR